MVYVFIKTLIWYGTQDTIGKKEKRIYIYMQCSQEINCMSLLYITCLIFEIIKKKQHLILVPVTLFFWLLIF